MASVQDFFLTGDQATGRAATIEALTAQGFRATDLPNGNVTIQRGSLGKTLLLGALAGKNFHVSFIVEFFTSETGGLVVRLSRDIASGALKGGAIGAVKVDSIFTEISAALAAALSEKGLLASVTAA
jgi:hypothetical protein